LRNEWFQNIIGSIADRGRELLGLDTEATKQRGLAALCRQLLAGQGEASGIALSQEILRIYGLADAEDKLRFFQILEAEFGPDPDRMQAAMARYLESRSADDLITLNSTVESPRQELFRRLNMAPHGTAALVSLRADLLGVLRQYPALKAVDADLKHILSSWFNRGFLQLRSIDWRSPAHILEKLISYEAVHEIQGWDDLRRRLMKDRRCFAFFHPAMPDEPLIFIEVAFVRGLSGEVGSLLDPAAPELDPKQADTVIFYSINNTQKGLRGVSFGNFLIKQVATELTNEYPWIKVLSTLSPIPSFASAVGQWLDGNGRAPHAELFGEVLQHHGAALREIDAGNGGNDALSNKELLKALLATRAYVSTSALAALLADLALAYLSTPDANGKLPDPVATFHLSNGARLERLNSNADVSENGIAASYGMMANYRYDLKDLESNHEAFVSRGVVTMSDALAKKARQYGREK
jgi:malonyl-CoA decarboxylase